MSVKKIGECLCRFGDDRKDNPSGLMAENPSRLTKQANAYAGLVMIVKIIHPDHPLRNMNWKRKKRRNQNAEYNSPSEVQKYVLFTKLQLVMETPTSICKQQTTNY